MPMKATCVPSGEMAMVGVLGRTSLELSSDADAAQAKVEHDRTVIESGRSLTVEEIFPGPAGSHPAWLTPADGVGGAPAGSLFFAAKRGGRAGKALR